MRIVYWVVAFLAMMSCSPQKKLNKQKSAQVMNTPNWINNTNVYEVNLRQYTPEGTFNAFAKELPRLKDMGVHTLWFMPITPIAQKNKKGSLGSYYAASDYTSINPEFGTLDDFKALVTQAHQQGFKVIIDWVANHTGWDHTWTRTHPDWYEKDEATGDFKKASGMDDIIELNFKNPQLRRAMIDAMKYWVQVADIDGFRCDLAFWVELDFWLEAKKELQPLKPLFWLGELDPLENPGYMQVFDAAYTWQWMHKAREFYQQGLPVKSLDSILQQYQHVNGLKAWFTTNHDENSWNGTEYEKYGDAALPLAVFSCTWPGVPLLYSGQELPNLKRLEFFEKDVIEWQGEYQLHGFYKTLLNLKAQHPALAADGPVERLYTSDDQVFAYVRRSGDREVLVLLNLGRSNASFTLPGDKVKGTYKNVFTAAAEEVTQRTFQLKPWEYIVLEK